MSAASLSYDRPNNEYLDGLVTGYYWDGNDTLISPYKTITYSFDTDDIAWSGFGMSALENAFEAWSSVIDLSFVQVDEGDNENVEYFLFNDNAGSLGWHYLPTSFGAYGTHAGAFNENGYGWDAEGVSEGGLGYSTILHEIGHGIGLDHPHDATFLASVFPGVGSAFNDFGVNNQNQEIFTVMSYNSSWAEHFDWNIYYGNASTPMALDIAAAQFIYGMNDNYNSSNDIYYLPNLDSDYISWECIWDTGGTDVISGANSSLGCEIWLTDADLVGTFAGGRVSVNRDVSASISAQTSVQGGFTIANGVLIENAIGSNFNDLIYGNDSDNSISGSGGDDILAGFLGADILNGNEGDDTFLISSLDADTLAENGKDLQINTILDGGVGEDKLDLMAFGDLSLVSENLVITENQTGQILNFYDDEYILSINNVEIFDFLYDGVLNSMTVDDFLLEMNVYGDNIAAVIIDGSQSASSLSLYHMSSGSYVIADSSNSVGDRVITGDDVYLSGNRGQIWSPPRNADLLSISDNGDSFSLMYLSGSGSRAKLLEQTFEGDGTVSGRPTLIPMDDLFVLEVVTNTDINGDGDIGDIISLISVDGSQSASSLSLYHMSSGSYVIADSSNSVGDRVITGDDVYLSGNRGQTWSPPRNADLLSILDNGDSFSLMYLSGSGSRAKLLEQTFEGDGTVSGRPTLIPMDDLFVLEVVTNTDINGDGDIGDIISVISVDGSQSASSLSLYHMSSRSYVIADSNNSVGDRVITGDDVYLSGNRGQTWSPPRNADLLSISDNGDSFSLMYLSGSGSRAKLLEQTFESDGTVSGRPTLIPMDDLFVLEVVTNTDINGDGDIGDIISVISVDGSQSASTLSLYHMSSGSYVIADSSNSVGDRVITGDDVYLSGNRGQTWSPPRNADLLSISDNGDSFSLMYLSGSGSRAKLLEQTFESDGTVSGRPTLVPMEQSAPIHDIISHELVFNGEFYHSLSDENHDLANTLYFQI